MSGGRFDYVQNRIADIYTEIEDYIDGHPLDEEDEICFLEDRWLEEDEDKYVRKHHHTMPNKYGLSKETIKEFKKGIELLKKAQDKADWLHGGFSKPIYRHYKGDFYEYLGDVIDSETSEVKVAYQAVCGQHEVWVRPKEMFFGNVEVDGKSVPRFEELDLKDLEKQAEKSNGQKKD